MIQVGKKVLGVVMIVVGVFIGLVDLSLIFTDVLPLAMSRYSKKSLSAAISYFSGHFVTSILVGLLIFFLVKFGYRFIFGKKNVSHTGLPDKI